MRLWCDGFRGGAYIAFLVMCAEWSRVGHQGSRVELEVDAP